jgi:predicted Ser/Thr protein kinase
VFLGALDMAQNYFLHGAGEIQHMLLMAWAGEPLTQSQWENERNAVKSSHAEIWKLGVLHGDVRRENTLWNSELNRVLIIDFHKSELIQRQTRMLKRKSGLMHSGSAGRPRLTLCQQIPSG